MADLQFAVGAYRRSVGNVPELRLVNCMVEKSPASPTGIILLERPGMAPYADFGSGAVRGIYAQAGTFSGEPVIAAGAVLYRGLVALGTIPGTQRVVMAGDGDEMVIATVDALYRTDGVSVAPVAFPDNAGVLSVGYLGGYFIAGRVGSQKFYWSAVLDGTSWNALDFASAERAPDNLVALFVTGDELWLFGEQTTEVWTPTGDPDAAFTRIAGRLYARGCRARDTVAGLDNTVFWVGDDGIVYRADAVPQRISDYGIEERISRTPADDLVAWAFAFEGHTFYVLATAQGTFAYDASTGEWAEYASLGYARWRAHVGVMLPDGTVIAGDENSGKVWRITRDVANDDGVDIQRIFTAGVAVGGGVAVIDNLTLDMATGNAVIGDAPVIEMRRSRDGGQLWTDWLPASTGLTGQFNRRVTWKRLGSYRAPGLLVEFRMTDAAPLRVSRVRINEEFGAAA